MEKIGKVTIIGVGLIGGSLGLAIKARGLAREVVGVGHRRASIRKAERLKAIDYATLDAKEGVRGADMVILATPILDMPNIAKRVIPNLKEGCVITDVGSTKSNLVHAIEKFLPKGIHFVGAHPMAGTEKRGVGEARGNLFNKSLCIVTRTPKTNPGALARVAGLWKALGASVVVLPPSNHDRIVAEISHLPHMTAFAMVNSVDSKNIKFASTGFYDTTRIASSDAHIWKDIALSNGWQILKTIGVFKKNLSIIEKSIRRKDSQALVRIFKRAKAKRDRFLVT